MSKYEVSDESINLIVQMCDVALKAGGLANKPAVDIILNTFETGIRAIVDKAQTAEKKKQVDT